MNHRATQLLLGLALVGGVSCIDMSAPTGGPASVSTLQVPALFVVRGDVMRDTAGTPAPLSIVAYDQNGDTMSGVKAQFFITDTGKIAQIGPDNIVSAFDTTGLIHVIGQVGGTQTPPVTVYVTEAPASINSAIAASDTIKVTAAADTTVGRGKQSARATVLAADRKTTVAGVRVHFSIAYTPDTNATTAKAPRAVYLVDDNGKLSSLDTADGSGAVGRTVVVIASRLADQALVSGAKTDSVVVLATATYRGRQLGPVALKLPLKVGFSF
ncbi:MAG TPA: hypothetical protein VHB25_03615 [Gemmatimonadaceae bacterium]|nr:hypothetical protein [Gemmatimonadaceae bacterium]